MIQPRFLPYLVLLGGVLIAATSSIFIRFAQALETPSVVITTWRLLFAMLILTPFTWQKRHQELRTLKQSDLAWGAGAGLFLALHLATWIASLEFTSVASSAALVTTNPLWVALAVWLFFGEKLSPQTIIGLLVAFTGSLLITFSDARVLIIDPTATQIIRFEWQNILAPVGKADTALFGDALALFGAISIAIYFLVGRNLRKRISNTSYVWLVYSAAALVMLTVTVVTGHSLFGYSNQAYFWMLMLAVGPQLLGHTAFNWALAHLSTTFVTLAILGEPIGSAILAYFLLGETFAPMQLFGFTLLLGGIGLGVLGEQQPS
ncbi:DMT family transporter [Anaerolineales bacterium HSG25]|nr:DMT family transporter [Anaerolineales bacterium HSG25]